jgi:uncharacterized membrane protein
MPLAFEAVGCTLYACPTTAVGFGVAWMVIVAVLLELKLVEAPPQAETRIARLTHAVNPRTKGRTWFMLLL